MKNSELWKKIKIKKSIVNTIIYLADYISDLSKTKLLKLLYLLEECSVIRYKTPFLDFEVWQAGPVAKEVFIDLSNDEQVLLKDFITMENKSLNKYGQMTATDLVKVVDAKNSLWYKLAEENKDLF